MEIRVKRITDRYKDWTPGMLFVGKAFKCFTLEDEERMTKKKGETRIPPGRYKLDLHKSPKFGKSYKQRFGHDELIHLLDVKGFRYILIHSGNTDEHTDGCILVGMSCDILGESIGSSRKAYKKFIVPLIKKLKAGADIWLTVEDADD